jgi:hypothetical protein
LWRDETFRSAQKPCKKQDATMRFTFECFLLSLAPAMLRQNGSERSFWHSVFRT